ncbi:hypothetical protein [Siccibacter turicensis]|uniref:hypothetical protein n=2 Tax=Siccibacter turicensis TaxID=357233 RepID=UPI00068599B2|nr:hypothetical protein [Siccibacter turicensis]
MRYFLLAVAALFSSVAMATQMEGFGANYYDYDNLSVTRYVTHNALVPDVIVGDGLFVMEFSSLADIAKKTGVAVNQDDRASWICLSATGINYWFISDNEMGHGDLTTIAVASDGKQKGCSSYGGDLRVKVKGIPLLGAAANDLALTFPNEPGGNITQYCTDTKRYGDFTQTNCLQYYFDHKTVGGVMISQMTSN